MSTPAASLSEMPYKCTPVFDENTLPVGLRREHRTKPGVWGVIRVLEGRLRYRVLDRASEVILEFGRPGALSSMSTSRTASKASSLPATSRAGRTDLPVSESASNIGSSPSARARQRRTTSSAGANASTTCHSSGPNSTIFGIAYVGHAERWDKAAIDGSLDRRDCTTARGQKAGSRCRSLRPRRVPRRSRIRTGHDQE